MSQVLVTLDSLISYSRGLDNRLKNPNKYPDSWVKSKINAAYELMTTKRQPFLKEDVLDLTEYIADGTSKFEVEMDEDVIGHRDSYYTGTKPNAVKWQIAPDHKVMVDLNTDQLVSTEENIITFNYYFFPSSETGDQYMSTDVYHMLRHAIASSVYDAIQDYKRR